MKIVDAIANGRWHPKVHHLAHADLVHTLSTSWNPLYHRIIKVKSHREKREARGIVELMICIRFWAMIWPMIQQKP